MTVIDRTPARRVTIGVVLGLAGAILFAGCGGAATPTTAPTPASTPAPSAAPAVTPAPTAPAPTVAPPTAAPTEAPASASAGDNGGFAFAPADVFAYYKSQGFACQDPEPSGQAARYTIQRCTKEDATNGQLQLIAIVTDPDGVTGDAFAGVLASDGKTVPTPEQSLDHLSGFVGAMLGPDLGMEPGVWLARNLGAETAQTTAGDLVVGTYTQNDSAAVGIFVEIANKAFMDAPAP